MRSEKITCECGEELLWRGVKTECWKCGTPVGELMRMRKKKEKKEGSGGFAPSPQKHQKEEKKKEEIKAQSEEEVKPREGLGLVAVLAALWVLWVSGPAAQRIEELFEVASATASLFILGWGAGLSLIALFAVSSRVAHSRAFNVVFVFFLAGVPFLAALF